jgi:hypothetical protein
MSEHGKDVFLKKDRFLYMFTGQLENDEISRLVRKGINRYIKKSGQKRPYQLFINAVEDKNYQKKGYAHGWISDTGLFHALIGNNEDGSSRVTYEDDPNWEEPEDDIELTLDGMNWGEMAFQEECPKIRIEEPPLIEIDSYLDKEGVEHTIDFFETAIKEKHVKGRKNELYSNNLPHFIDEKYVRNVFKKFTTDKTIHIKKVKKERVKIEYPTVKIFEKEGRRTCLVEFSPIEKNIAAFINTMTKKLQYGNSKKEIIFFSHSKKRI